MKQIVKNFNNLIKKTIFKVQNKTNDKLKISNFNKILITFIGGLFFYLFYLLIPLLYDKSWVQINIENKIVDEFKINLSSSADISYRILPYPHFLIKNSKILLDSAESQKSVADIKNLKIFISQKNFFEKEKMNIKELTIDKANFTLLRNELKILNDYSNNKFSNKKIKINDSKVFFKDNFNEIITITKIDEAILFFDEEKQLNLFDLKGHTFGIYFSFQHNGKISPLNEKRINIKAKSLKLNIFNEFIVKGDYSNSGKNIISFFNSTFKTKYNIKEKLVTFASDNSRLNNLYVDYNGEFSTNPFDLDLKIDLGKYKISKLLTLNSTVIEFIKTGLLFNKNLSVDLSILAKTNSLDEIFQTAKINFNIVSGKLNLDNTILTNKKIGLLRLDNSNLIVENNELILETDVLIEIKNSEFLYSFLNTNKKLRKEIKNIVINLKYDFLSNEIQFNKVKIDNKVTSDQFLNVIDGFKDNSTNNLVKSRRLINKLLSVYDG